jgi:hypothetical protein
MSYHCLNNAGKTLLCDYICGLLKVNEFTNQGPSIDKRTVERVSKRLKKFKKENLESEKHSENGNNN